MKTAGDPDSTQYPVPGRATLLERARLLHFRRMAAFGLCMAALLAASLARPGAAHSPDPVRFEQQDSLAVGPGTPVPPGLPGEPLRPIESTTQTPQAVADNHATRTPRPTATPPEVPPPANPTSTNLMTLFGVLIVGVILFGLWLNRRRAFPNGL